MISGVLPMRQKLLKVRILLTNCIWVDCSTVICWTDSFVILFLFFYGKS